MLLGHPGKLAKLAAGHWDTHSSRSPPATEFVGRLGAEVLGHAAPECPTVEGMFAAFNGPGTTRLANVLAEWIAAAVGRPSVVGFRRGRETRADTERPAPSRVAVC